MTTADKGEGEIHVLMVAFASQGHINPMLRLAKRLVSKGLHVTLATTEFARHRMLKSNVSTPTTTDAKAKIHFEFFSDGLSLDFDRRNNLDHYMDSLEKFGSQNLSNLIKNLSQDGRPKLFSCIINNPFVPWVADVAAEHGIPCAMLWIQPCALYAIYYRYYNNLNPFPTLTNPNLTLDLPNLPLLHTEDLPSFLLPSNSFDSIPKLLSQYFRNIEKVTWVLGNSFYELEKDVVKSMTRFHPIITPIGPLVPPTLLGEGEPSDDGINMWKAENSCLDWLDEKPISSVIYVSFGSLAVLSAKQMENIALGLKNSNFLFLWVVKPLDHVVKDGSGELPSGFLEETEGRGLVVSWCPQAKVLAHPAIACFLSHCGWNSVLETITSGVPMITFPQWSDQPTNAKLIVDVFDVGLRLRPDKDGLVSKEEVERCIAEIVVGPKSIELKKKALKWKEAAREAVADGGSSDRNLQTFVDDIAGRASKSS